MLDLFEMLHRTIGNKHSLSLFLSLSLSLFVEIEP